MNPLIIKLHWKQQNKIGELLKYEEPRVIRRANILSCLDNGMTSGLISKILHVDPKTVRNVAHEYLERGMDAALYNDEQSGRPIDFDDKDRSRIIAMICSNPPSGCYRWTLDLIVEQTIERNLTKKGTVSREQIRIILQEHDLKPWQEKMWCIEKLSDEYIGRMEKILDIYALPYNNTKPIICVDEKPIQLIENKKDPIKMKPGSPKKVDYEYQRNGTVNTFVGVEPLEGKYFTEVTERKTGSDFAKFIKKISDNYPDAEKITLVMDNYATHKEKHILEFFGETEGKGIWSRFEPIYTPKHASWLNQAEIAIGMYSRQCLAPRMKDINYLEGQTKAWTKRINKKATKIQWRFTKSKARKSLNYEIKNE